MGTAVSSFFRNIVLSLDPQAGSGFQPCHSPGKHKKQQRKKSKPKSKQKPSTATTTTTSQSSILERENEATRGTLFSPSLYRYRCTEKSLWKHPWAGSWKSPPGWPLGMQYFYLSFWGMARLHLPLPLWGRCAEQLVLEPADFLRVSLQFSMLLSCAMVPSKL